MNSLLGVPDEATEMTILIEQLRSNPESEERRDCLTLFVIFL